MRERIVLASGLNGNELTRSLALHGVNCIGLRICSAAELARLALIRSGVSITEDFVSTKEEAGIIAEAVAGEPYFGKASYSDIQEITSAVRLMRRLIGSGDEAQELESILSQGSFKEKNNALLQVYRRYRDILSQHKAVDAVSLIRIAAEKSKVIDADFLTLREYPLDPLESMLLERISGGTANAIGIHELFGVTETKPHLDSIKNCYGAPNEVESIIEDTYTGKRLDQCTVAVADGTAYGQLFFDYAILYDIPVTFGCGIPIINSNPAKLLALYNKWITSGFFGRAALNEMLGSKAFNKTKLFDRFPAQEDSFRWRAFYDVLGGLRLTNDREINKKRIEAFRKAANEEAASIGAESRGYEEVQRKISFIPCLEIVAEELSLPPEEFILKYAYIRKGNGTNAGQLVMILDMAASRTIYEEMKAINISGADQDVSGIIPNILSLNVCAQRSEPGKLHVTVIKDAFTDIRKNLYIAGLSASNFPGSPRENYLLLDEDLKLFDPEAEQFTADGRILLKRNGLLALARLASALGSNIFVSYSGLDVSELKKDNPSSLIFELFREGHGNAATSGELEREIRKVDYFEPAISVSRLVGSAYSKGQKIRPSAPETVPADMDEDEDEDLDDFDGSDDYDGSDDFEESEDFEESDYPDDIDDNEEPYEDEEISENEESYEPDETDGPDKPSGPDFSDDNEKSGDGEIEEGGLSCGLDKAWSPTALDSFFSCPRQFMLKYILEIPEPEDYDPFAVISAMDSGTLAHSLMEALGREYMDAAAFMEKAEDCFDCFLSEHPPLIMENVPMAREHFLEMMETAYEMDPHREVVMEEEDICCTHESGVKLHGFPDRVEKLDDGTYLVVDFKSGRNIKHKMDDIVTCQQVIIYAYLLEQKGFHVSGGEYRYIRLGKTVTCRFDDDMKQQLSERLMIFKKSMLSGRFPVAEVSGVSEDPCKYCKYKSICEGPSSPADMMEGQPFNGSDQTA